MIFSTIAPRWRKVWASNSWPSIPQKMAIKILKKKIKILLIVFQVCCYADGGDYDYNVRGALLQAKISAVPLEQSTRQPGKIQPGTKMKISAVITNVGDQPNAPGKFFVRFAYPKPLDKQPNSLLYQSETVALPAIDPGDHLNIVFSQYHLWPSMFDFIRQDWSMREYEGIVLIGSREHLVGSRGIAFTAFYYEGPPKEQAAKVSTSSLVKPHL